MSLFGWLFRRRRKKDAYTAGLAKTRTSFLGKIRDLFQGGVSVEIIEQMRNVLLTSDVGPELAEDLEHALNESYKTQKIESYQDALTVLKTRLLGIIPDANPGLNLENRPAIIILVGVNGAGKTTTIAKLGHMLGKQGKKTLLSAGDTFRAGAAEQLDVWAKRLKLDIVAQTRGADPASVAYDSVDKAISKKYDALIIDTAGRLHTKKNLVEELKKVVRVVTKRAGRQPDEILLVLDGTFGQNAISQAQIFIKEFDVTGIIVTKLDGTTKGGFLFEVSRKFGIPVKYIGLGEKVEDLVLFEKDKFVDGIFGE